MDCSGDGAEEVEGSSSPTGAQSPVMDRNPSPPPDAADGEEDGDLDAIGDTVYSKHWLFSTLTRVIHMVKEHSEVDSDGEMQLLDGDEEDLCRVWDMAMDKDVAGFLQEFKVTDILLGMIAKSRCPRLTEICVGILGNIACFPDTCQTLSQNEDLGAVLLLLLGDTDPPTLLETSRLLLTCVSQKDVCSLWLQRIRQQTSVRSNLFFMMCSSTNSTMLLLIPFDIQRFCSVKAIYLKSSLRSHSSVECKHCWIQNTNTSKLALKNIIYIIRSTLFTADLLEKVGELVNKLFDLDEDLMNSWITAQPSEEESDGKSSLEVTSCLLEAAKQLRSESPNGLEVYLHTLQLLTTTDEGIQTFAASDGRGEAVWRFVCDLVCEDLCQPTDLPVVLQEQKSILVQAFAVLQALYRCQDQWHSRSEASLPLIGTILRVLQYHSESRDDGTSSGNTKDEQLQTLAEITTEFLADICIQIHKDTVADLVKKGYLTEKTALTAAGSLVSNFKTSLQHLQSLLSETDAQMADMVKKQFPV